MKNSIRVTLGFVLTSAAVLPLLAVDGQKPIPLVAPIVFPIVIDQPGSYVLTRNLTAPAAGGGDVIVIAPVVAGEVQLNLNGFTLSQLDPTRDVIWVNPSPALNRDVKIYNGVLKGGKRSVLVGNAAQDTTRKVVLEDIHSHDAASHAIELNDVRNAVVRRSVITFATGAGIRWRSAVAQYSQGAIEHSQIEDCGAGIDIGWTGPLPGTESPTFSITNNNLARINGGHGISLNFGNGIVADNTVRRVTGANSDCISVLGDGNRISGNVLLQCGRMGIYLDPSTDSNLILKNTVRFAGEANGNFRSGIGVDGGANLIEGNVLVANNGWGLQFFALSSGNAYRGNFARGNLAGGNACANPCSADLCLGGAGNSSVGDNLMPAPPCN